MKKSLIIIALFPVTAICQPWFSTNQYADLMVSGVGFNQTGGPLQFNHPNGLASDGTNLLLCDHFNNRVLVWKTAPAAWNAPPDLVLGQQDFSANDPGTSKSNLNWPGNVSAAKNGKVAVADSNNDRLLLWNSFPAANGQAADISIHLPTLSPSGAQQKWSWPWGVWTDGERLAAVATFGATLLFWNTFPVKDNQPPDYTITHAHFGTPRNISTDGATFFFVGDHNAKVNGNPGTFFWNSYPKSANQPYDFYRNEWIKGARLSSGKLLASGIRSIYTWDSVPQYSSQNPALTATPSFYDNGDGVDAVEAGGRIYVCNYNGNNVLVYDAPPTGAQPNPFFALGVANYFNNTLDSVGYIQNPCLATDGKQLIVTSDYNRRIYIYNNLPTASGQMPDTVISTARYNLAPWDNALFNNTFAAVGLNNVCIWNNAGNLSQAPSVIFSRSIGNAVFNDLKGVALDTQFFYLADRDGKVYIWKGIPANSSINPLFTLNLGTGVQLNRLSSDGTYFCVTQQSPPAVFIYKVAELANGNTTPWKTISGQGLLNLPSETIPFDGALAIANQSFNNVLLWQDINDAPNTGKMTVLGQANNSAVNPPAIGRNRLFMPGALLFENGRLWVGEHKFSSRILRFSYSTVTPTHDLNRPEAWSIYPNPVSTVLQLRSTGEGPELLAIVDVSGRCWYRGVMSSPSEMVDVRRLPPGLYWVIYRGAAKAVIKN